MGGIDCGRDIYLTGWSSVGMWFWYWQEYWKRWLKKLW